MGRGKGGGNLLVLKNITKGPWRNFRFKREVHMGGIAKIRFKNGDSTLENQIGRFFHFLNLTV